MAKRGQFLVEKLNVVVKNIKSRKATSIDEISPEIWWTSKFDSILVRLCNAEHKQNTK